MKKCILFDLDGTLTDSGPGIIHCAQLMLERYGMRFPPKEELRWLVGPPLRVSFPKLGIAQEKMEEAIALYREYYEATGIFENEPYPGIGALLQKLKEDGHRLFVATSKPEYMAKEILERFHFAQYFEVICGCQRDGVRDKKADVVAFVLQSIGSDEKAIMVGDTAFDVVGAAEHYVPTVGVSWGYGEVKDMMEAGAVAIATTMDELYQILSK
jgi:phosphoglycolate phosphatase